VLASVIETVKLAAVQNISSRGDRDDGHQNADGSFPAGNDGKFRMLLCFRIQSGDKMLKKHLSTAKYNALYTIASEAASLGFEVNWQSE